MNKYDGEIIDLEEKYEIERNSKSTTYRRKDGNGVLTIQKLSSSLNGPRLDWFSPYGDPETSFIESGYDFIQAGLIDYSEEIQIRNAEDANTYKVLELLPESKQFEYFSYDDPINITESSKKYSGSGDLKVPIDKKIDELPYSHFYNLAEDKGYKFVLQRLLQLHAWNTEKNPKLADWLMKTIQKLERDFKSA